MIRGREGEGKGKGRGRGNSIRIGTFTIWQTMCLVLSREEKEGSYTRNLPIVEEFPTLFSNTDPSGKYLNITVRYFA